MKYSTKRFLKGRNQEPTKCQSAILQIIKAILPFLKKLLILYLETEPNFQKISKREAQLDREIEDVELEHQEDYEIYKIK